MSASKEAAKKAIELIESGEFEPVRGTFFRGPHQIDARGDFHDRPCGCIRGVLAYATKPDSVWPGTFDLMLRADGFDPAGLEEAFEGWDDDGNARSRYDLPPARDKALELLRGIVGDELP